ncbi:MAG: phage holin family protein [Pseudomonadota bacterium]
MEGILVRLAITALGLWLADSLLTRVVIDGTGTLLISAAVLGLINAFVRPVLQILTLPFTIVTLGIFLLILNALMLSLASGLVPGFSIDGLGAAFLTWVIVSLTSWIASGFIGDKGRYELLVRRRDS